MLRPGPWGEDPWDGWWGEDPPFHTSVFVLTHHARPTLQYLSAGLIDELQLNLVPVFLETVTVTGSGAPASTASSRPGKCSSRGSGKRAGGQHEAKRRLRFCSATAAESRAMQAGSRGRGNGRLGNSGMVDDPLHDRGRVGALGEDHSTLDHLTTRRVRTRQACHQLMNRIVVHSVHTSLSAVTAPLRSCDRHPTGSGPRWRSPPGDRFELPVERHVAAGRIAEAGTIDRDRAMARE
jgi:hypothetical protein